MSRPDPALIGVLVLVALLFATGLGGEFVYDDLVLVAHNPALHDPFDLVALVTRPLYGAEQGFWRPLTMTLLSWGRALGGGGPVALHAIALALHLFAVTQAVALGRGLGLSRRAALGGGLLFGVCPLVVEPVSWVAAINDPLWACCALGALRAHLRWRAGGGSGVPSAAAIWLAAGLLSKESALSIGPLLLALDLAVASPPRPPARAWVRAYGLYGVVAVAWFVLRAIVLRDAGLAIVGARAGDVLSHGIARRVEILGRLGMRLVWPQDPTPFSAPAEPLVLGGIDFLLPVLTCAAFVALLVVAVRRRWSPVSFAVLSFFAVVLPIVLRPQALGPYPIADRYLYVSACTASLAFAWGIERSMRGSPAVVLALALIALGCGIDSFLRIRVWSDQATLIATGHAHHPDDPRLDYMAGRLALERYAASGNDLDLDRARKRFDRAESLLALPQWGGEVLIAKLRADVALGLAWCALADENHSPAPRWDRIVQRFQAIVDRYPEHGPAFVGLGVAEASAGRPQQARAAFERAVALDPRLTEARVNLARVLAKLGDRDGAREQLDAALELRPDDAQARAMRDALGR